MKIIGLNRIIILYNLLTSDFFLSCFRLSLYHVLFILPKLVCNVGFQGYFKLFSAPRCDLNRVLGNNLLKGYESIGELR